jgi:Fe-S oxidoreductase
MALFGFGRKDVLYFPGCFSSAFPLTRGKAENYQKILKKLKINFFMLKEKEFVCCGGFLEEAGYEKNLRKIARENLSLFKEKGVKKIITSCPLCHNTLKNYKELLPDWDIDIEFILTTALNAIKENENFIKTFANEPIAYYDSCYLARYSSIVEQPREFLIFLGYNLVELPKTKEETLCCGSCGNLPITNPQLANQIAGNFIKMLKRKGIKKIVTADARAYKHLKENLDFFGTKELEILEFSDIICDALDIKRTYEIQ